jgi:hypothetical protein
MSIGSHHSPVADTTTWLTPPGLINSLGEFDLDPCTPAEMPWATARCRYTPVHDGLVQPWFGRVWLNPPYGREVDAWMKKMCEHNSGVALIFARTETACWHDYIWEKASGILFLRGRLHFHYPNGERAKANAGAPSALVAYGDSNLRSLCDSGIAGRVVRL